MCDLEQTNCFVTLSQHWAFLGGDSLFSACFSRIGARGEWGLVQRCSAKEVNKLRFLGSVIFFRSKRFFKLPHLPSSSSWYFHFIEERGSKTKRDWLTQGPTASEGRAGTGPSGSFLLTPVLFLKNYVCLAVLGLCCCADFLQLREQGPLSSGTVRACHCGGFSCCGAQALGLARLQQLQLPGSGGQAP